MTRIAGSFFAFHGRPRATKHIDLLLAGGPDNLRRAALALTRFGAPPNVVSAIETMGDSDVVFMGQPPLRVDFMRTIDGIEPRALFDRAIAADLDGVPVRVISLPDLIRNKRAPGRPQDVIDAEFLERLVAGTPRWEEK